MVGTMTGRAADGSAVTVRDPADVVRLVPYLLGFVPQESLVLVCLRGRRPRVGLTMRVDLPAQAEEPSLVRDLARRAAADDALAVLLLCFTEMTNDSRGLPRHALLDRVTEVLGGRDIGVSAAVLVRGQRWWSYPCGAECCPSEGSPVSSDDAGPVARVAAAAVLEGRSVLPSRDALRDSVRPVTAALPLRASHEREVVAARLRVALVEDGAAAVRADTLRLLTAAVSRRVEGGPVISPLGATRIVLGLRDVRARDAALAAATGDDPVPFLAVVTDLARAAAEVDAAPVCAVLAVTAYAHGDGALANVAVERALESEPDYPLALLVLDLMHHQVPPWRVLQMTCGVP